jgi:hypothetical protein
MREFGFDWDDLQTAPYISYKEIIVQLPDIAAYRAARDTKLTACDRSELVDAPVVVEMGSVAE